MTQAQINTAILKLKTRHADWPKEKIERAIVGLLGLVGWLAWKYGGNQ